MIKQDYKLIARVFVTRRRMYEPLDPGLWTLHELAKELADALAVDNPRFDRAKFLVACGFPEYIHFVKDVPAKRKSNLGPVPSHISQTGFTENWRGTDHG
jgi:hypothetical protein